jgi:hypothetical protein
MRLQEILRELLELYRGNPENDPIADLGLSPSQKIMLSVHETALRQGSACVFTHRLALALYPPFVEAETDPTRGVHAQMHHLRSKLGCEALYYHAQGLYPIDEPIRCILQAPDVYSQSTQPQGSSPRFTASSAGL